MLTSPKLKSQVDALWDKLWSGGLSNPMDAIEQFSYLLFFKRLDDAENLRERQAKRRGNAYQAQIKDELRWGYWTKLPAKDALKHVKEQVFPSFKKMGVEGSSFERYMQNAEFKINKSTLLIEACNAIDEMQISAQNQDVQGDLYEYLLSKLNTAGRAGQFRTPRHIIRMMVAMSNPQPHERIADLAAGTCGFLVNAYQHILAANTTPEILEWDEDGGPRNLVGDLLTEPQRDFLQREAFRGYDNDSGMTMLRIGSMNLMLHGIRSPQYFYMDTLSKEYSQPRAYDLILMNPPFKGKVDKANLNENLPSSTTKSELLFVHLILDALEMGGRAAVIVPDGVLFGSSRAHVDLRKKLIEENRLDGVVSMPSGVFKPYAGVSTAVLFFTRGASTERIWFYDMAQDGFSLDDKRQPLDANDIPDILDCWTQRNDAKFAENREERIGDLRAELAPLKKERLALEGELNRITFELALASVVDKSAASELDTVKAQLSDLDSLISPPQAELDQLTRQFWVDVDEVRQKKYDLSASRYRQSEPDESYHESPQVTLERLARLEQVMAEEIDELLLSALVRDRGSSKKWKKVKFGDVAQIVSGHGFKRSEYSSSGVKLLQIANVGFQEIVWDNLAYLPIEYLEQYPNLVLKEGDLLMALNRPILGDRIKFSFLKSKDTPAILYQRVGKIVVDSTKLSSEYLFGFMLTKHFYEELKKRLTGSDQPYINPTELVKIKIPLPPLQEQVRLSKILRKYNEIKLKQREVIRQADIFLQSILAEEFYDYPVENI